MPSTSRDTNSGEAAGLADSLGPMPPPARSQTMSSSSQSTTPAGPSLPSAPAEPPYAGIPGPIPDDFDFDGRIIPPGGIARFELPLAVQIKENVNIEQFNNASILRTVTVKDTAAPPPADMDIGPTLKPLFFYSDEDLKELVDGEPYCDLFALLPASLQQEIVKARSQKHHNLEVERQVQKERDKEADASIRVKLLGSMGMTNPVERNLGEAKEVVIPTVYLLNIRNWYPPPLHCCSRPVPRKQTETERERTNENWSLPIQ
ncbi:hypothetical protein C0992_003991 [Termitomyces sp. T32_za158]|nr:hypothetical protein C0992_003991 [Termitomyces sp. T32_za158]